MGGGLTGTPACVGEFAGTLTTPGTFANADTGIIHLRNTASGAGNHTKITFGLAGYASAGAIAGIALMANGSGSSLLFGTSDTYGSGITKTPLTLDYNASAIFAGRIQPAKGANVASGSTVTLGTDGNVFHITGTTTVNLLNTNNWQAGSIVVLIFDGVLTLKHNQTASANSKPFFLSGAADVTTAANMVMMFAYDGTYWYEIRR